MIEPTLMNEILNALHDYQGAIARTTDAEEREDYLRLAGITEKILAAMQSNDVSQVKLGLLGFSRQVSDSFAMQPPEFKALAQKIAEVKRRLV